MATTTKPPREPDIRTASFDEVFRATAARVLRRKGVADDAIAAEIERLRRLEPSFGPLPDELRAGGKRR